MSNISPNVFIANETLKDIKDDTFNLNSVFYEQVRASFLSSLKDEDKSFGMQFSQTQIFQSYLEELKQSELDNLDNDCL